MNSKNIKAIFSKEIVGAIRDKRTLITMIVVPLIFYPLLFIGMGYFSQFGSKQSEEFISNVVISGEKIPLQIIDYFESEEMINLIYSEENINEKLKTGEIQAIINIYPQFKEKIEQGETSQILLEYDATETKSRVAEKRIMKILEIYKREIISLRLNKFNLQEEYILPVTIEAKNVASSEKVTGTFLGFLLPYLIILLVFSGAMHTAIDITAGEKERGTIATLLVSQVSRLEIVLGKCMAVITISLTSMILGLFGVSVSLLSGNAIAHNQGFEALKVGVSINSILLLFLILLPLVVLISSILIIIGIFARTMREASSYVTPIYMLTIFLGIISISQGIELSGKLFFIPILNSSFVFKEILIGKINWNHILFTTLANSLFAGIALIGASRLFNRESVLFRN